jgi:hypothetical protein
MAKQSNLRGNRQPTARLFAELRFPAQDVVIVLGEAVGFVADILK